MLWSEKSLSTLTLGIILELASRMIKSRVLDSLCVGLSTLLTKLKLSRTSRKVAGPTSNGLYTAMLKSPNSISSPLELMLVSSRLASSLQNSNTLVSGGL